METLQSAPSTGDLSRTTTAAASNFDFDFGESFDVNGNDRSDDFNTSDFDSPDTGGPSAASTFNFLSPSQLIHQSLRCVHSW